MTELKTLSELELRSRFTLKEWSMIRMKFFLIQEDLWRAAIAHVKYLQSRLNPATEYERWKKERVIGSSDPYLSSVHRDELDEQSFKFDMENIWIEIRKKEGMIHWIKYFFNLTEEDLK